MKRLVTADGNQKKKMVLIKLEKIVKQEDAMNKEFNYKVKKNYGEINCVEIA